MDPTTHVGQPTIKRTKISINTKKKEIPKRNIVVDPEGTQTPAKQMKVSILNDEKHSLNEVTLIHRSDGLQKDTELLSNILNSSLNMGPNYVCHICNVSFFSTIKLKMHFLMEHSVQFCKVCDLLIENEDMKSEHDARIHGSKNCSICQDGVEHTDDLAVHYKAAHDAIVCVYCDVILHPMSHYGAHLAEKHYINDKFLHKNDLYDILEKHPKGGGFFCNLCEKTRHRELLGHFTYYHKTNIYFLKEIILTKNIDLKLCYIDSDIKNKVIEEKIVGARKCSQKQVNNDEECCIVCLCTYTQNVPKTFHQIFCESQTFCSLCHQVFENIEILDKHTFEVHRRFECIFDCKNIAYNSQENLKKHYAKSHKSLHCYFCDEFISNENDAFEKHLQTVHSLKTNQNCTNYDYLIKTSEEDGDKTTVVCVLCNANLIDCLGNADEMFLHFQNDHALVAHKIFELVGSKPSVDYVTSLTVTKDQLTNRNADVIEVVTIKDEPVSDDNLSDVESGPEKCMRNNGKKVSYEGLEFKVDFDPKFVKFYFDLFRLLKDTTTAEVMCEFCNTSVDSKIKLIAHLYDQHNFKAMENVFDCVSCNVTDRNFQLETHMEHYMSAQQAIREEAEFVCKECGLHFAKDAGREHVVNVHSDILSDFCVEEIGAACLFCKACFWNDAECQRHEIEEHLDKNKKEFFQCFLCEAFFPKLVNLIDHECEENYTSVIYQCTVCTTVFPTIPAIRTHFRSVHPKLTIVFCTEPTCKKTFALKKYAKLHYKNLHERNSGVPSIYDCEICARTFTNKKSYLLHTKNSHAKGFKCVICGDKFQTSEHRKHHYATVHPGELVYECPECQKTFLSKSSLHVHTKLHNEFSSKCTYCGKEFFRRDSYKEHLLIHIGPKHQCPYCPKVFTQKSNLRRHIRLHTGEKPYTCPYCPKKFSDKGACNSHVTVHTRSGECYCEVCGKKFSKQQKLRYHMKRHTGEGLVQCDICQRGFTSTYDLNKHLTTHDQQTQIICECGRGFSSEKYLRAHIKIVHDPSKQATAGKKSKKGGKNKFNCFQCLLCKNYYSLRTTILKHLRNLHQVEKKEYSKNLRKLGPEEEAFFTRTILNQGVDFVLRATEDCEEEDANTEETTHGNEDVEMTDLIEIKVEPDIISPQELCVVEHTVSPPEVGKKPRNRKHKNPLKYCGDIV